MRLTVFSILLGAGRKSYPLKIGFLFGTFELWLVVHDVMARYFHH